jgi:hypothetical protein
MAGWTSSVAPPIIEERLDLYDETGRTFNYGFDEMGLAVSTTRCCKIIKLWKTT